MKVFLYSCGKKKLQEEKLKRSKEARREIYLRSLCQPFQNTTRNRCFL